MLPKTMYLKYVDRHTGSKPLPGYEFLKLPYHERLRLAGYGVLFFGSVKETVCDKLNHHPRLQVITLPELSKDQLLQLPQFGVYLLGSDGLPYPVFALETEIVELHEKKETVAVAAAS